MRWTCVTCDGENRSPALVCVHCGADCPPKIPITVIRSELQAEVVSPATAEEVASSLARIRELLGKATHRLPASSSIEELAQRREERRGARERLHDAMAQLRPTCAGCPLGTPDAELLVDMSGVFEDGRLWHRSCWARAREAERPVYSERAPVRKLRRPKRSAWRR